MPDARAVDVGPFAELFDGGGLVVHVHLAELEIGFGQVFLAAARRPPAVELPDEIAELGELGFGAGGLVGIAVPVRRAAVDLDVERIFLVGIEVGRLEQDAVDIGLAVGRFELDEFGLLEAELLDLVDVGRGQRSG